MAQTSSLSINAETAFLEHLDALEITPFELRPALETLFDWRRALIAELTSQPLNCEVLAASHVLAKRLAQINEHVAGFDIRWEKQWQARQPAQELAHYFADKLMFLVFGKFNAGKSSFCNFIAERFSAQGHDVEYFTVEAGEIKTIEGPFKEGDTETTAEIQGLVLANRMVLLDTPGLHSLTAKNAALTRQFLESADGMLWLSSSTSPGQVQELDTLALELRRRKPLLPVITRSDFIDEDIVGDEIVKVVCNKTADNRHLQEQDLRARAIEKLTELAVDADVLAPAVSVSVYAVNAYQHSERATLDGAMSAAGFYRFYEALGELLPGMVRYKQRKPAEVLLHHLEEDVLEDMTQLQNELQTVMNEVSSAVKTVQHSSARWAQYVWQQGVAAVPGLLDEQIEQSGSVSALAQALRVHVHDVLESSAPRYLSGYVLENVQDCCDLGPIEQALAGFEQVSLDEYESLYECLDEGILAATTVSSEKIAEVLGASLEQLYERLESIQQSVQKNRLALNDLRHELLPTHHT